MPWSERSHRTLVELLPIPAGPVCDIAVLGAAENIINAARTIPARGPEIRLRLTAVILSADPRVKVL